MNPGLSRIVIRLYPLSWRERYGEEFMALLESSPGTTRNILDIVLAAIKQRFSTNAEVLMQSTSGSMFSLTRKPSAFVPLSMSVVALGLVLGHVAMYGVIHEADEGAVAHLWQLLIAGHLPLAAWFAIRWLPQARKQALFVLALLAVSMLANLAAVYFLT